mmetsp:Transcript_3505/g.8331  ORF Transcript_3505/g.8331 Transcript_3505/m.8331 type:complete len:227 (-) Transcript_3505:507-1187(-)
MLRYATSRRAWVAMKPVECETSKPPSTSIETMSMLYSECGDDRPRAMALERKRRRRTSPVTCRWEKSIAFWRYSISGENQKPSYTFSEYLSAIMSRARSTSRSSVMASRSRWAARRIVPPGVSYTPRDLIPTKRFSTMSMRPIECSPPSLLSILRIVAGVEADSFVAMLITLTGSPFSKRIWMSSAVSLHSVSGRVYRWVESGGVAAGSSRMPDSKEMWNMLSSML